MKRKIIIILAAVVLVILSALAVKKYIDNSLVDKNGMVRQTEYSQAEAIELF